MTVSSEITRADYPGNDITVNFPTGFRFLADTDLSVILTVDSTGVETPQVISTDYTVTGAGDDSGGTVSMIIKPATGETLTILRDMEVTQETDYVENDSFPAASHETALDKLTMIAQQDREAVSRALTIAPSDSSATGLLPTLEALKFIRVKSDLTGFELVNGTTSVIASDVTNTPAGNISSLNVQDAIYELDTEKEPADTTILKDADIGSTVQAYDASTAKTDEVQDWTAGQSGEITALADAANIETDLALSNFFSVTLAGNRTLDNPTNIVSGQSGSIFITQDGTGTRTLAYGSYWGFNGGNAPLLSTAGGSVDRLDYVVRTATSIHAVMSKAVS